MQEDIIIQISNRLKELRKEKDITLQELAMNAGVTKGLLSQIENSRTIPSLPVLINLIKALEIDLNNFFKDLHVQQNDKVIFRKASQYQSFEKENADGFHYQRIFSTYTQEYHIDYVLLTLDIDATRPMVSTNAYEFKYLLQGSVEYQIGDNKYSMEAGDSLYFDATEPHNPINTGNEPAILLVIYFFKNA
ncbi:MAG: XRE family transcriptional regulator [Sediminibacterium sp.]|nr:XRE family transcriptional regulator [Sediminibacterium sp.]